MLWPGAFIVWWGVRVFFPLLVHPLLCVLQGRWRGGAGRAGGCKGLFIDLFVRRSLPVERCAEDGVGARGRAQARCQAYAHSFAV